MGNFDPDRLKPKDEPISALVSKVLNGTWQLPEFQREFVWNYDRRLALFEALWQQYPVGMVLIWRYDRGKPVIPYRAFSVGDQAESDVDKTPSYLVLDGQQRLTALAQIYHNATTLPKDGRQRLLRFNPRTEQFSWTRAVDCEGWDDSCMPVHLLLGRNARQLIDGTPKDCRSNLDRLAQVLHGTHLTYQSIPEVDLSHALQIFERVNSEGTRLTSKDIAVARLFEYWHGLTAALRTFDLARKDDEDGHHGAVVKKFTRDVAIKSLLFELYGTTARRRAGEIVKRQGTGGVADVESAWGRVEKSLSRLREHLVSDLHCETSERLSENAIVVGATFFRHRRTLVPQDLSRFNAWFYWANHVNHYSGRGTDKKVDSDLQAMTSRDSPWEVLYAAIAQARGEVGLVLKPEEFGIFGGPPLTRGHVLWMLARNLFGIRGARDWMTQAQLRGTWGKRERHHIFPRSAFGSAERKRANHFGNMAWLCGETNRRLSDRLPEDYLHEVCKRDGGKDALTAQCISSDDAGLWRRDNYERFVQKRTAEIAREATMLLDNWREGKVIREGYQVVDTDETLRVLLLRGESQRVEYKRSFMVDPLTGRKSSDLQRSVIRAICGFANSGGGTLLIGVADDASVPGVEIDLDYLSKRGSSRDWFAKALASKIRSTVQPSRMARPPALTLKWELHDGRTVCRIAVQGCSETVKMKDEDGVWKIPYRNQTEVVYED